MKILEEKARREIENVFAYALSIEQEGRQKNTIFCHKDIVYILNYDKTLIFRFHLPEQLGSFFERPIGFFASDYDSSEFYVEGEEIVFITRNTTGMVREKHCKLPNETFEEVDKMFKELYTTEYLAEIDLNRGVLEFLEQNLSHIEFKSNNKNLVILQRDIYAGSIIRIRREDELKGGGLISFDDIKEEFGPLGMRTNDFFTLFGNFENSEKIINSIMLYILPPDKKYFISKSTHYGMTVIIGGCLYDQIGEIYDLTVNEPEPEEKEIKRRSKC